MNVPDVSNCSNLDEASVIIALSQEGVVEVGGNNFGPEVKEYLASVHLDEGNPWCCGFAVWCIKQAAKQLNIIPQMKFHASVYQFWHDNQDLVIPSFEPNCLVLKNEGLNHAGHPVGHLMFGIKNNEDNTFNCISGNTNNKGSREGNCCAIQDRNFNELSLGYGFLKIV